MLFVVPCLSFTSFICTCPINNLKACYSYLICLYRSQLSRFQAPKSAEKKERKTPPRKKLLGLNCCPFKSTVKPRIIDTRLIRTPSYYGQFALSLGKESPYTRYKYGHLTITDSLLCASGKKALTPA